MCKTYKEYKSLALRYKSIRKKIRQLQEEAEGIKTEAIDFMETQEINRFDGGIFTAVKYIRHWDTVDKDKLVKDLGRKANKYLQKRESVVFLVK